MTDEQSKELGLLIFKVKEGRKNRHKAKAAAHVAIAEFSEADSELKIATERLNRKVNELCEPHIL